MLVVDDPSVPSAFGGIYDVPEAARYLTAGSTWAAKYSLRSQKLIRWIRRGLASPELTQEARRMLLGFEDLISMRVIAALRASGISWREIRTMEQLLRKMRGVPWPFATEFLWTGQGELFAQWAEYLVSGSRHGQAGLDLLREYVMPAKGGLVFGDESRLAISWEPFAGVVLKPLVQFGAPCVKGTRIPTRTIFGMIEAGDSPEWVAAAYEISSSEVQAAYDWEYLLANSSSEMQAAYDSEHLLAK